jgi:hypothetical protein
VPVGQDALVIEAVVLRDLPGLVVPAQEVNRLGKLDLQSREIQEDIERVIAVIDVAAHENEVLAAVEKEQPDELVGRENAVGGRLGR